MGTASNWSVEDLKRRLAAALEVAARALPALSASDRTDSPALPSPDKVIAETAILLIASQAVCQEDVALARLHGRLADLLVKPARSERISLAICFQPRAARELAFAHTCLTKLGLPDSAFQDLILAALATSAAMGRERLPHRELEQDWIKDVAGQPQTGNSAATLQRSMVGLGLDRLALNHDDIYAFTHAVMYASCFGTRRPRLPRGWSAIEGDVIAGLAFALDREDYDLVGELLLVWPLLHRRWHPVAVFAFHVVARVEDEAGFVPPPALDIDEFVALSPDDRPQAALARTYHTAYVGGLLAAAAVRHPPPSGIPARRSTGAGPQLLGELSKDAGRQGPHWLADITKLSAAQLDSLYPFLLDIALQRAFAELDIRRLRDLLELVVARRVADRSAAVQAAGLLHRLATRPASSPAA